MKCALLLGFTFFCKAHECFGREWQENRDTLRTLRKGMSSHIVESASESIDVSPCLDDLRRLKEDPLDISLATAAELQQIPGLSAQAANDIVSYRDGHSIECIEDLRNIPGIEPELMGADLGPRSEVFADERGEIKSGECGNGQSTRCSAGSCALKEFDSGASIL